MCVAAGADWQLDGREVLWSEDGQGVVVDLGQQALVAAGEVDELAARWPKRTMEPPRAPYRGDGVVVARADDAELVVHRGEMLAYSNGWRTHRTWLPDHWDLSNARFGYAGSEGIALHDGELLFPGRRREPVVLDVGASGFLASGYWVVFPERPSVIVDAWYRTSHEVDLLFTAVRPAGEGWAADHRDRLVLWGQDGTVRWVSPTRKGWKRRLSADGRRVAFVRGRSVELMETAGGESTTDELPCAGTVWPVEAGGLLVTCASDWWTLRDGAWTQHRAPGGNVRRVVDGDDGWLVVVGEPDRMGEVWTLPDDGGLARASFTVGDEVEGYVYGRKVRLGVRSVDGRPVERATAAAYEAMALAAAEDEVTLRVRSGFRTWEEQAVLYGCWKTGDCNNGNLAARPGHSRHQSGHALDLNTEVPAVRAWLEENAAGFGFHRTVRSEPWHWEYTGEAHPTAVAVHQLPVGTREPVKPRLPWPVTLR